MRVLSSIRVKMISPIVMLAIGDASSDMSPYVRKTAAHAIPKLYRYVDDSYLLFSRVLNMSLKLVLYGSVQSNLDFDKKCFLNCNLQVYITLS